MSEYNFKKEDHLIEGSKNILWQFQEKKVFNGILNIILSELNKIEDLIDYIIKSRNLSNAKGLRLDLIGKLFCLNRSGLNDEDFLSLINFNIILNSSKGTPESLINNIKFITKSDFLQYSEGTASVSVVVSGYKYLGANSKRLNEIAPLGVEALVTYANRGSFGFDNNPLVFGFGDLNNLNDPKAGKWSTCAKLQ